MEQGFLLLLLFLAVAFGVGALIRLVMPTKSGIDRLEQEVATGGAAQGTWLPKIANWLKPAAKITQPKEEWMHSRIRRRLINAGYRGNEVPIIFFAAKTILALALPLVVFLLMAGEADKRLPIMIAMAIFIGYYAPNVFLILRIRERQRQIFEAFPDALDLMVVCVEAGLGLDAAIAKVGEEIGTASPALGEEFRLANLELRAGLSREAALRNLALRTGVQDIDTLVAMLIQTDKFGTSIADALRVHADGMRTKRMLRAEETAQKLPVKLVFPVVLFIFPSLFLVLLGPSVLAIAKMFTTIQ